MPLYSYVCEECGEKFEALLKNEKNKRQVNCPNCQSSKVRRLLDGFSVGKTNKLSQGCSDCGPGGCPLA